MITGVHTMFYSSQAEEMRAFIKDKLKFPYSDVGGGWLIFDMPSAEMGVHPSDERHDATPGTHNISFHCDNIQSTVADLKSRGVEFTDEIAEVDYGFFTHFKMPGGVEVQLYQPKYKK